MSPIDEHHMRIDPLLLWKGVCHSICKRIKHWVLKHAHPEPECITVYLGTGVYRSIVENVLACVNAGGIKTTDTADNDLAVDASTPCAWVDGDDVPIVGWMAVCRYLGRLGRIYPVDPLNAAHVDTWLETLAPLIIKDGGGTLPCLAVLEAALDSQDEPWLGGMDAPSLADACWLGALEHAVAAEVEKEDEDDGDVLSTAKLWWVTARNWAGA